MVSGCCLIRDAPNHDSFIQSPALGSHLTHTRASPRGPGESGSGLAPRSPSANKAIEAHALLPTGVRGKDTHPRAARGAWRGAAMSQQLMNLTLLEPSGVFKETLPTYPSALSPWPRK